MALGSDEKIEPAQTESPLRGEIDPELTTPDRDERLREVAYFLWLDDGCPDGEADSGRARSERSRDEERSHRDQRATGHEVGEIGQGQREESGSEDLLPLKWGEWRGVGCDSDPELN